MASWLLLAVFFPPPRHGEAVHLEARRGALRPAGVVGEPSRRLPARHLRGALLQPRGVDRDAVRQERETGGRLPLSAAVVPGAAAPGCRRGPWLYRERLEPFALLAGSRSIQPVGESGNLLIAEWQSPFKAAAVDPSLPWLFGIAVLAGLASFIAARRWPLPAGPFPSRHGGARRLGRPPSARLGAERRPGPARQSPRQAPWVNRRLNPSDNAKRRCREAESHGST